LPLTLTIERLAAGGLGLARHEGRIVFLPGVLPGEEVQAEITSARSDYLQAKPLKIVQTHPRRIEPPCPLFLECGGCQLMHAAYPLQFHLKTGAALEALVGRYKIQPRLEPAPSPLFYRARVRLHTVPTDGRLALGFFAASSRRLIPVAHCYQLQPAINEILPLLAEWTAEMSPYRPTPTQLEVLAGPEGFLFVWDLPARPGEGLRKIIDNPPAPLDPERTFFSVRGRLQAGRKPRPEHGLTWFRSAEHGLRLLAWPGSFVQVNPSVNTIMVADAVRLVKALQPGRVLDLFCGLGNFTLPLAAAAGRVVGVENNPAALANARLNQNLNQIGNVSFIRRSAVQAVQNLADQGELFEVVLLDPPRAGARGLASYLARLQPESIFYFSCHPATLTRDLAEFTSLGFKPAELTVYDMFPQTAHLEILTRLVRG